jgi:hypothetical protein
VPEEREGDQRQRRVPVQPRPRTALGAVEPQLLLESLVRLLAGPTGLEGARQPLERGLGRQVGDRVLPLARGAPLADEPVESGALDPRPAGAG